MVFLRICKPRGLSHWKGNCSAVMLLWTRSNRSEEKPEKKLISWVLGGDYCRKFIFLERRKLSAVVRVVSPHQS